MTRPLQTWERKESLQPLFLLYEAGGRKSWALCEVQIRKKQQIRTAHKTSTVHLMETANEILLSILESLYSVSQQWTAILHSNLNAKLELLPELYLKILELSTEEDIVEETETANLFQNEGTLILWLLGWMQCYLSHLQLKCNLSHLLQMNQTLKTDKPKW